MKLETGMMILALLLAAEAGVGIASAVSDRGWGAMIAGILGLLACGATLAGRTQAGEWLAAASVVPVPWLGLTAVLLMGSFTMPSYGKVVISFGFFAVALSWLLLHPMGVFASIPRWGDELTAVPLVVGMVASAYWGGPSGSSAIHHVWKVWEWLKLVAGVGMAAMILVVPAVIETRKMKFSPALSQPMDQWVVVLLGLCGCLAVGYVWNCRNTNRGR